MLENDAFMRYIEAMTSPIHEEMASLIKAQRKARGWSRDELAVRADVSRSQIERIENGRAPDIGLRTLWRLLTALGHDLRALPANSGRPTLGELLAEDEAGQS